jgi:hypothetical protein
MIITMTVVRMVKASIHQIVDVVPVRNRLVPAARPVRMTGADILWRAMSRVGSVNCYHVLVDMISVHVMQMTIVQVVNVAFVLNRRVSTPRAMLMGMIGVFLFSASRHGLSRLMNAHPLQPLFASPAMGICEHLRQQVSLRWLVASRQAEFNTGQLVLRGKGETAGVSRVEFQWRAEAASDSLWQL